MAFPRGYAQGGFIPNWNPEPGDWRVRLHTQDEIHTWEQVQPVPVTFDYAGDRYFFARAGVTVTAEQMHRITAATVKPEVKMAIECCCGDPADPYWEHEEDMCTWRDAPVVPPKPAFTPATLTITANTTGIHNELTLTARQTEMLRRLGL